MYFQYNVYKIIEDRKWPGDGRKLYHWNWLKVTVRFQYR